MWSRRHTPTSRTQLEGVLLGNLEIEVYRLRLFCVQTIQLLVYDLDFMLLRGGSSPRCRLKLHLLHQLDLVPEELLLAVLVHQFDLDWNVLANVELRSRDRESRRRLGSFDAEEATHLLVKGDFDRNVS